MARKHGKRPNLRQRIASSQAGNRMVAGLFRAWMMLVWHSSRRHQDGWDHVERLLEKHGAIIIVTWHQRLMLTPWMFDLPRAPCRSLTSAGRAGRLVGWVHRAFGYDTVPMPRGQLGAAEMRMVLKGLKQGISIGISPDGPRGPARKAKTTPLKWARTAQVPIVTFTFSASRFVTWGTWDRLMFPLPFGRVSLIWRHWDRAMPDRFAEGEATAMALELETFMNDIAAESDQNVGHKTPQL
jgi:lysophospholipid acyltransferase (LPLAT)-like uncharacterized protein